MPRRNQLDKPYLIARRAGFLGLEIPLLTDEECKARGIAPAKWPPRDTWTQSQRDAADKLTDLLCPGSSRGHASPPSLRRCQPTEGSRNPNRSEKRQNGE
jgi:hypothetical protein